MKTIKKLTIAMLLGAAVMPAMAQPTVKGCKNDSLAMVMVEPVSLYQQDINQYKNSNPKDERYLLDAYQYWTVILENCPKQSKNLYINGANILKAKIAKAQTAEERKALVDEMLHMYDVRIANYGEPSKYTAMKAMAVEEILGADGLDQYYELYSQAVRFDGDLEAGYLVKFMEATINYVRAGKAEPTLVVDNYDIASDLLDEELRKNAEDSVKAATIRGYIAGVEAAFSPYASCDQLVEIYGKKFESDPNNVELLKKITGIMMRKRCTDQPLFFQATENLYRLEPTPTTAMRMAQMCNSDKKKEYSKAIEYLKDAIDQIPEKDKYNAYMQMGIAYYNLKSYAAARSAFNNAASADPSKGEPYRMIAACYASNLSVASEDNVGGRSVYWVAVDALAQAKRVDPSPENVEACDKLISVYSAHFPKMEDAFAAGLMNGQSFTVPGLGVVTKVRTR